MALALGAAQVPSLSNWLSPGLIPRMEMPTYPILHPRNDSSSANNTINMFLDSTNDKFEYAASIVTACVDTTVYALRCTNGPVGSATCGPNAAVVTITSGSSTYAFSSAITTETLGVEVTGTAQETCKLAGTTAATCTATIKATAQGSTISTATSETLSGATYYRFDVAITGGAEKTASPTACGKTSAAEGMDARRMGIWGLVAVAGVVGVQIML